jgi:hypothetical protein
MTKTSVAERSALAVVAVGAAAAAAAVAADRLVRRPTRWGSTADERTASMPGDAYLEGGPGARTVMTRAISIAAPPMIVWPWLAQMGRGAGWYSGTTMRMVVDLRLLAEGRGSRLVIRVSGDATGLIGVLVVRAFEVVDSVMAIHQLKGIRSRAETYGARTSDPATPETGQRDQFQLYEAIWTSGQRAGSEGHERAAIWRRDAEVHGAVRAA